MMLPVIVTICMALLYKAKAIARISGIGINALKNIVPYDKIFDFCMCFFRHVKIF